MTIAGQNGWRLTAMTLTAAVLLALLGCQDKSRETSITPVGQQTADELNAQTSRFETSEDPPFTAQTHFAAGKLAESQQMTARAISQYQAALKVDPHHTPSIYRLGVIYTQTHQYPAAVEMWKKYVDETKGNATAYSNLAFAHQMAGQLQEAESAYQHGIGRDPQNRACRVNYGIMLAQIGRADDARQQWRAVLTEAQVEYNFASVYEQMGQKDAARQHYRQALQLDPAMREAKTRLAALDDAKP